MALDRSSDLYLLIGLIFWFYFSVLACRLSWPAVWSTFGSTIKYFDWLTDTVTPSSAVRDLCVWLWPDDAEPHIRQTVSAAYRTSPSTNLSVPVAYCCTRSFPIGLLQHRPVPSSVSNMFRIVSDVVEKKHRLIVEVESLAPSWKELRRVDVKA